MSTSTSDFRLPIFLLAVVLEETIKHLVDRALAPMLKDRAKEIRVQVPAVAHQVPVAAERMFRAIRVKIKRVDSLRTTL